MSAQSTPGPWEVEPGYGKRGIFVIVRRVKPGFVQYLGADGRVKAAPSRFRSEEAAHAALAKATGAALNKAGGERG